MVLNELTFVKLGPLPLIGWLGIVAYLAFVGTALIPILRKRGIQIPFPWHMRLAYLALSVATLHGALGVLAYF